MKRPTPQRPGPGKESVWDYPRPPRLEPCRRRIRVIHSGALIAETTRALRVLETSHPPIYYIPPEDVRLEHLEAEPAGRTMCEWKGRARYFNVTVGGERVHRAAWSYPSPVARFSAIKDYLAFYPGLMDACLVDDEQARPQPGRFYGGWITSDLEGPFKGAPGSEGW